MSLTDAVRLGAPWSEAEMVREKDGLLSLSRVEEREITPVWLSMVNAGSSQVTEQLRQSCGQGENHSHVAIHFFRDKHRMKYNCGLFDSSLW